MSKNLVIVESPAKAKTIEKFLGQGYSVMSSYGHIRDLSKEELGIDLSNHYTPNYIIPADKTRVVNELCRACRQADTVWLASDEDREGEAIAWHLYDVLSDKAKLGEKTVHRIVFHEITKQAILNAIDRPRDININVVNAQQARRVLDRIVGFELSPVLWRRIKGNLSAGRVQSVAVRLIVEREREINAFQPEESYRVVAEFADVNKNKIKAELVERVKTLDEARAILQSMLHTPSFSVTNVDKKLLSRRPQPPFTTSTLQQEAGRKCGYPVATTMQVAQSLYERGIITYMRTDSVNLSGQALAEARDVITTQHGQEYYNGHNYTTHTKGAQEAHEAIRPTNMRLTHIEGTPYEQRLYDLILKRTLASQMADAKIEKTTVTIMPAGTSLRFTATGEVIKFDGYLKVYRESSDQEETTQAQLLPAIGPDEQLSLSYMTATQRFSQRPARYTEASLVHKLEELGIGRPSTYAPTISTIIKRGYVDKHEIERPQRDYICLVLQDNMISDAIHTERAQQEKGKLSPTDIGLVVNDYLVANMPEIMDYNFTAEIEKQFDEIAENRLDWVSCIDKFYHPFHQSVELMIKEKSEHRVGERLLGSEPATGEPVYVKIGRFGPMAQIGEASEEKKPRFASLRPGQSIETITLDQALELFRLPITLGEYEEKSISVNVGRFGPYVRFGSSFCSIPKGEDPLTVTLERAIEIIRAKQAADLAKIILHDEEHDLTVLHGRFKSIYIAHNGLNYRIPKSINAEHITLEQALAVVADEANCTRPKKTTARKSTKAATAEKPEAKKTATKKTTTRKTTARKATTEAEPKAEAKPRARRTKKEE